jgi:DNA (cytosine-5)-methyltransferase 1
VTFDFTRPWVLDLFCGEGGAARGYIAAGFNVLGVDLKQSVGRYYPGTFIHGDWRTITDLLRQLGARPTLTHASAPCQLYSITNASRQHPYPDLVGPVRDYLTEWGVPFVLENVERAPLRKDAVLCGAALLEPVWDEASEHYLYLRRHRIFEAHGFTIPPVACACALREHLGYICGGVYGGGRTDLHEARNVRHGGYTPKSKDVRAALMGVSADDFTLKGLSEAIPPVYAQHVARAFLASQKEAAAA